MKLKISLVTLFILLSFTTSFSLISEDKIIDEIATSINEHPEHWIDTGSEFVYCDDSDKMKHLKTLAWPKHESNLVFIYNFYTTFNYVILTKPFEYNFKGKKLKGLIQTIKLYKLNKLWTEIGNPSEKKREPAPEQIKPQEEKTIEEKKEFNKL